MTLQPHEIYHIEKYLLEQDLISLEFYNEMLDHFISSIETFMAAGDSFKSAFIQTRNGFIGIRFSLGSRHPKYTGIKALEQERMEELRQSFKSVKEWTPINLFRSKNWDVWLLVCIIYLVFAKVWSLFFVQLISTSFVIGLAALVLYYSIGSGFIFNENLFGRWSRFLFSSLVKRKNILPRPNFKLYVLVKSFRVTLFVFPYLMIMFLRESSYLWQLKLGWNFTSITSLVMLGYMLKIIAHFIHFKKEYEKTLLEKA